MTGQTHSYHNTQTYISEYMSTQIQGRIFTQEIEEGKIQKIKIRIRKKMRTNKKKNTRKLSDR